MEIDTHKLAHEKFELEEKLNFIYIKDKMVMKKLLLVPLLVMLTSCENHTKNITGNYALPPELADCSINYLKSTIMIIPFKLLSCSVSFFVAAIPVCIIEVRIIKGLTLYFGLGHKK